MAAVEAVQSAAFPALGGGPGVVGGGVDEVVVPEELLDKGREREREKGDRSESVGGIGWGDGRDGVVLGWDFGVGLGDLGGGIGVIWGGIGRSCGGIG